jgi:poly(hydroxyalkanoate) granule-associated protein
MASQISTRLEATMVKKLQKASTAKKSPVQLTGTVKDSAQQIWLAGLGAFTKAQSEGGKVFETLVKEGLSIQRKTQAAAEEKITEATSKMAHMATGITTKATGQWDKLENIFEDRVAKALNKLGVPSSKDVEALIARIDELNKSVQKLSAKAVTSAKVPAPRKAAPKATPKAVKKPVSGAAKTAVKRAPVRKAAAPGNAETVAA